MLVDANLLVYAIDTRSRHHSAARAWLENVLNGQRRVGFPWASLGAFLRLSTNPRVLDDPLTPSQAWAIIDGWLEQPVAWIPTPGDSHHTILRELVLEHDLRGNLISDAVLVALCIEHGLEMFSADTDFARFPEITWRNPLAA